MESISDGLLDEVDLFLIVQRKISFRNWINRGQVASGIVIIGEKIGREDVGGMVMSFPFASLYKPF